MVAPSKHCTIRIERAYHQRLMALAAERNWSSSRIINEALAAYFNLQETNKSSDRRMARIGEFSQLVLDLIIREQFPEYRERLLAETDRLMERFHAA